MRFDRVLRIASIASQAGALALVVVLAVISWRSARTLLDDLSWVEHTHVVIEDLATVANAIGTVQREARGYVITGDVNMWLAYREAEVQLREAIAAVRRDTADNGVQQRNVAALNDAVGPALAYYEHVLDTRHISADAATTIIRNGEGAARVRVIERTVERMRQLELRLLQTRSGQTRATGLRTAEFVMVGNLVAVLAVLIFSILNQREIHRRITAQRLSVRAAAELEHRMVESEQRSAEVRVLATLGEYLQAAQTESEASAVTARHLQQLFPRSRGRVLTIAPSRDATDCVAEWPDGAVQDELPPPPTDCWALRKGSIHQSGAGRLTCAHLRSGVAALCIPMTSHGEVVGLLTLEWPGAEEITPHVVELARSASEQVSLAYSGLALREALRRQAVRDPLTGLFNRRYAEESLGREIGRASRRGIQASVLLIDVDFFKQFNDALGHGTGDRLLREIAAQISSCTRSEDVAARYGGDEFMVIFSEAKLEDARRRAEEILRAVRTIPIIHPQSNRGPSLSIGAAAFPDHGRDATEVVEAADVALYLAKQRGRDRVECARDRRAPDQAAVNSAG